MQKEKHTSYPIVELLAQQELLGKVVTVNGWVRTRRDSKAGVSFIALSDGSCLATLQVVVSKSLSNYYAEVLKLTSGCALRVIGTLVASPAKGQAVELQAEQVEVVGWVAEPDTYPIAPKYHTVEYLREYAHLRPRTNIIGAVTRIRHTLSLAIHRFLQERGFFWIQTPIITSNDCEGAGQLLRVTTLDLAQVPRTPDNKVDFAQDFFGREAFLTVSGQLNVEAYCAALTRVYTFGPTFRAENSNTSRHLAEFWMVEPELAFADLKVTAELAAELICYLAQTVLTERRDDMEFFAKQVAANCITRLEKLISSKFTYMEYSEAVTHLQQASKEFVFPVEWGADLQTEHERYLTEELIGGPVIVVNYPKEIKSFYMRVNADDKTVAAMDLLVPGVGEIIGGSQREERYEFLLKRMVELGLKPEGYQWYLDLRRYGSVPHAGFGLGLERILMYITGMQNIRDTIPFPRTVKHAEF